MKTKNVTLIDKLTDFIETKLAPPLIRISQIRYLEALQKTFMVIMPYMIIGSTATLLLNLGGLFAEGSGLNMPQVAEFFNNIVGTIRPALTQMVLTSINLLALLVAILNGYFLGSHYNKEDVRINPIVSGILGMISFLCFIDFWTLSANFDWPSYILGAPSLFSSIFISIIATEIYVFLTRKNITIKMPEGVPPMVADAFTSIIPVTAVVIISSIIGKNFGDFNLLAVINELSSKLVVGGSNVVSQFIAFVLDRVFWFVGLHGSNIVGSIMEPIWATMQAQNLADFNAGNPITYLFSALWVNSYVRLSVFPIAVLCCISKVKRFKVLGKLSIAGSIFNIAEPIMYGLPIVLNPLMFVPWVIGFGALFIFNAILTAIGLIPPIAISVVWTMPVPLMALIGSGFNITAMIVSIINMVILFFIFLPFFKVMEKQEMKEELANTNQ